MVSPKLSCQYFTKSWKLRRIHVSVIPVINLQSSKTDIFVSFGVKRNYSQDRGTPRVPPTFPETDYAVDGTFLAVTQEGLLYFK